MTAAHIELRPSRHRGQVPWAVVPFKGSEEAKMQGFASAQVEMSWGCWSGSGTSDVKLGPVELQSSGPSEKERVAHVPICPTLSTDCFKQVEQAFTLAAGLLSWWRLTLVFQVD